VSAAVRYADLKVSSLVSGPLLPRPHLP
jgi:hypothetical protein